MQVTYFVWKKNKEKAILVQNISKNCEVEENNNLFHEVNAESTQVKRK